MSYRFTPRLVPLQLFPIFNQILQLPVIRRLTGRAVMACRRVLRKRRDPQPARV